LAIDKNYPVYINTPSESFQKIPRPWDYIRPSRLLLFGSKYTPTRQDWFINIEVCFANLPEVKATNFLTKPLN
jgi:hypothetical protein